MLANLPLNCEFQNGSNKVAVVLRVVQFSSGIKVAQLGYA